MTTSKAIKILENRHGYILHKIRTGGYQEERVSFMIGELAAMERAVEVLAEKLVEERSMRAARHATLEMLCGRSEC